MSEYDDDDVDYDDSTELDDVHSTLQEIHSTLEQILSAVESRTNFSGLVLFVVFVLAIEGWSGSWPDRWTDKVWYSLRYSADFSNITVDKRPLDCDFFHAPIGGKGCDYKRN